MEWLNQELIKENDIGFIYIIRHNVSNKFYIGKKNLICYKTINKKKIYTESNWEKYWGSNKDFLNYIKQEGKENFTREIIIGCQTKIQLTYQELKYQILMNWESEDCYNSNLLGRIFKQKLQNNYGKEKS